MPTGSTNPGVSVFAASPTDPNAVSLGGPTGGDDAPVIQEAIAEVRRRDGYGIVFVPEGSYEIHSTVYLPLGIRLIGFGAARPVFVGRSTDLLIHVCNLPPEGDRPVVDADFVTFWSGINNINIDLGQSGGTSAVRFNVAQHSYLRNMDFFLGDDCIGIDQAGNEIEQCRFFGGRAAITTMRTSACWPFTMLDCVFERQEEAAIESCRAGITAIRCTFRDMPSAFTIRKDGDIEQLFARECRFENISSAVVQTADRDHVVNMVNVVNSVCINSPTFLRFRNDTPEPIANSSPTYHVVTCSHGLIIKDATRRSGPFGTPTDLTPPALLKTTSETRGLEAIPPPPGKDYPDLPPVVEWTSIRDAGAVGDGATDDTDSFRKAIADHRVVHVPIGRYRITDTLKLRGDTVLVGLQPIRTLFVLPPDTPGFGDPENPKPVMESPPGGTNLVTGIGFYSEENPGAVMLKWSSGKGSCVDDVWFGKEYLDNPEYLDRWTEDRDEDWRPDRPVTSTTRCGLWITGGGTFKNIWSSDWSAAIGLLVSDTSTPGRIYGMSVEHHLGNEVKLENVAGWSLDALQTEADPYSERTLAVEMSDCRDICFGNLFAYRRVALETSHPHAVRVEGCNGITFRGLYTFSWGPHPFSNSLYDADTRVYIRHREIACATVRPAVP